LDGQKLKAVVVSTAAGTVQVLSGGLQHTLTPVRARVGVKAAAEGSLLAPMPAEVVKVNVKDGDTVKQGQLVMLLEAMKMLTEVRAPKDGTVKAVYFKPGQLVAQKGAPLLLIE
jgi:biotin carboxyl carrier protein